MVGSGSGSGLGTGGGGGDDLAGGEGGEVADADEDAAAELPGRPPVPLAGLAPRYPGYATLGSKLVYGVGVGVGTGAVVGSGVACGGSVRVKPPCSLAGVEVWCAKV